MSQRHVRLYAPNFGMEGDSLDSYLHLGRVHSKQKAGSPEVPSGDRSGEDLAALVQSFDDDERRRCVDDVDPELGRSEQDKLESEHLRELMMRYVAIGMQAEQSEAIWDSVTTDPDNWLAEMIAQIETSDATIEAIDQRIAELETKLEAAVQVGPPNYCPNYIPPSERAKETARLHTKGGWRDHTDGNRIVTTRGDKLEVVGGNYRMLVMGRVQHQYNAAGEEVFPGWDISGGHVVESGISTAVMSSYPLPDGAVSDTKIEWVKNWEGTWKVKETSVRGDNQSTSVGDSIDRQFGKRQESYTGSENPSGEFLNPVTQSKSWSESTHSYTGSATWAVPLVKDETWVDQMMSTSVFDESVDETVAGKIVSETTVETMVDETQAHIVKSSTRAASMMDSTICESMTDITIGNSNSTTIGTASDTTDGDTEDTTVGPSATLTLGAAAEVTIGGTASLTVGASVDITMGRSNEVTVGGMIDYFLGAKLEFNAGPSVEMTPMQFIKRPLQMN